MTVTSHQVPQEAEANKDRNKRHYDEVFRDVSVDRIVARVRNLDAFLADATRTDTSWVAMYRGDFRKRLKGARVLELGSGDGLNALVMAALGADVVAIDISDAAIDILQVAAAQLRLDSSVMARAGDFAQMSLEPGSFDFIVGKAFLHHLTHDVEARYLENIAVLLKPTGEARFSEPAVNSRFIDSVRWMVPVPGRPSRFMRRSFQEYQARDPHPPRDNSSAHYRQAAGQYFSSVTVVPLGAFERFHRLLPEGEFNRTFRRFAFRAERFVPAPVCAALARAQLLVFQQPRQVETGGQRRVNGSGGSNGPKKAPIQFAAWRGALRGV